MSYLVLFSQMDKPFERFDNSMLGPEFPHELDTVSRLWFKCGYRPGIAAYLNFFLLKEFIIKHDDSHPPRFKSFKSMADSFYQTDLFIRDLTDSGVSPTGGISNPKVRQEISDIMLRHKVFPIPDWMMTYFGFSLFENVEKQCGDLSEDERRWHLQYMTKTYRIMGMPFSTNRDKMELFSRQVETSHANMSPNLIKHTRNILLLGEMIGVSSDLESIGPFLPDATRKVFQAIYTKVQPSFIKKTGAQLLGKVLMKQAVGTPRKSVPMA